MLYVVKLVRYSIHVHHQCVDTGYSRTEIHVSQTSKRVIHQHVHGPPFFGGSTHIQLTNSSFQLHLLILDKSAKSEGVGMTMMEKLVYDTVIGLARIRSSVLHVVTVPDCSVKECPLRVYISVPDVVDHVNHARNWWSICCDSLEGLVYSERRN